MITAETTAMVVEAAGGDSLCQKEVQTMEAAAKVPTVEPTGGGQKKGGQLPWEVATWVQPEGAASVTGR